MSANDGRGRVPRRQCAAIAPLLPDWDLGRLDAGDADRVRRHVAQCPRCAAEVAAWRRFSAAVTAHFDAARPEVPAGLTGRIAAAVRAEAPGRGSPARVARARVAPGWLRWLGWAGEWAGVLVAAAAALAPIIIAWAAPVTWAAFETRLAQSIAVLGHRLSGILAQAPASLAAGGAAAGTAVGYAWYVLPFILWAAVGLAISYATVGYATGYTIGDESGHVT